MGRTATVALALVVGLAAGIPLGGRLMSPVGGATTTTRGPAFSAVPDAIGAQDVSGPYEVVAGWPQDLSTLPGHEKWTYGSARGIFAESPTRVFLLGGGELPKTVRPQTRLFPEVGPNVQFPLAGLPWRNANTATPPGAGGSGQDPAKGMDIWRGASQPYRELGVDARWEHSIVVVNAEGKITEEWTQWDKLFKRPHAVYISPYDAEKHVWVVDDHTHAIYKFSNDGTRLVQTIGTPNVPGADGTHFNRPTFMAWGSDGSFYVADGYNGTRVAKFDANGKFLKAWGQKGNPPNDTRPNYFNTVHGIGVDPDTGRVYVNDRNNRRVQIFDKDGNFQDQFSYGKSPTSDAHSIYMAGDRHLWVVDRTSGRMIKYDLEGHQLYSWGVNGDWPGAFWGVHGVSVDQENNFYVAEVNAGRFQKYRVKPGVNPDFVIGQPVRAAWK
jgi:hypothetical protein